MEIKATLIQIYRSIIADKSFVSSMSVRSLENPYTFPSTEDPEIVENADLKIISSDRSHNKSRAKSEIIQFTIVGRKIKARQ